MRNADLITTLEKAKELLWDGVGIGGFNQYLCNTIMSVTIERKSKACMAIGLALEGHWTLEDYLNSIEVSTLSRKRRQEVRHAWLDGMIVRLRNGEELNDAVSLSLADAIEELNDVVRLSLADAIEEFT